MTAEGLKALYETELRYEVDSLGLGSEERQGLWQLLSASRRMRPGELREQDHPGVWVWSDLHLGHAMTLSVFGRPYWTPEEMDDALFGAWRRAVDPADTVVILGDIAIGGLSGRRLKRGLSRSLLNFASGGLPVSAPRSSILRHVSNRTVGRGQRVQGADQVA